MTHDSSDIGTIAHLPECEADCGFQCICADLRACEQRVRIEDESLYKGDIDTAYEQGWDEALNAAREAVASLMPADYEMNWCAAIDAIDALRQPPPLTAHYDPAAKDNRP